MCMRFRLTILAVALSVGCGHPTTEAQQKLPAALIVLPGAHNVRQSSQYAGTVTYDVIEPYPADAAIGAIRQGTTTCHQASRRNENRNLITAAPKEVCP